MSLIFRVLGLSLALVAVPVARVSMACSPPTASISERVTLPPTGAIDVPINARVSLRYTTVLLGAENTDRLRDIIVRIANTKEPLSGTVELVAAGTSVFVRFTPATQLPSRTTFEILDRVSVGRHLPTFGEHDIVGVFATGEVVDTIAPPAPQGVWGDAKCETCASTGCCDQRQGARLEIGWGRRPDDAWVELTHADGFVVWPAYEVSIGWVGSNRNYFDPDFLVAGNFEVRFVDVAGNRSEPALVTIDVPPCDGIEPGPESDPERILEEVAEPGAETAIGSVEPDARDGRDNGCGAGLSSATGLAFALASILRSLPARRG